jgi:type I restriction enzyme M protein
MFYNTGIATYIWLLDNNKPAHRKGKIQLIDATEFGTKMRKNLGSKNKEISEDDRDRIVKLYSEMADGEHSKILEAADFGYWEITVEQPLQLRFDVTPEAVDAAMEQRAITKLDDDVKARVRAALESLVGRQSWMSRDDFLPAVQVALRNQNKTVVGAPVMRAIWQAIGVHDDAAEVVRNSKGRPEPDPSLRDTELVPFRDDIEAYFEREVLPHVPNAWIDRAKTKVGYEIPFTRLFYKYVPPRDLAEIDADLERVTAEIIEMLKAVEG